MNIEIANRLVNLRKENNLSQEALAEKLGISRQAVSKWERAEASPDTDNLILLARLYNISLDSLLHTEEEIQQKELPEEFTLEAKNEEDVNGEEQEDSEAEYVHVGFTGVHVRDKDGGEVHVGWDGIHVDDKKKKENVHIDKNGVYVNGNKWDGGYWWGQYNQHSSFPIDCMIIVFYIIIGIGFNLWHPGWLVLLLIPIIHSGISAVRNRNLYNFSYPSLALLYFLVLGVFKGLWHPGWVVFLTIPLYYSFVSYIYGRKRKKQELLESNENCK